MKTRDRVRDEDTRLEARREHVKAYRCVLQRKHTHLTGVGQRTGWYQPDHVGSQRQP